MAEKPRVRPRIGDVVRITDADGAAAFAQFTHKHAQFGTVLRVLGPAPEGASPRWDEAAAALATRPTQFLTFFPLGAACHRGIAEIVGSAPIPPQAQSCPHIRAAAHGLNGRGAWWLWDGTREWRVNELAPEQRSLPIREAINDTLLVERAHAGWRHEMDV
jgi:hypothetical protein